MEGLCQDGVSEPIKKLLISAARVGVSIHHARLPKGVKSRVISAFREGTLRCLCCTTTLSVGVNLPADVVVVRRLHGWLGSSLTHRYLGAPKYCQIEGRCGRGKAKEGVGTSEGSAPAPASEWLGRQPTTIVAVDSPRDLPYAEQLLLAVTTDGGGITRENTEIGAVARHSSLVPSVVASYLRGDCCVPKQGIASEVSSQTDERGSAEPASGSGQVQSCPHADTVARHLEAESHPLSAFLLDLQLSGIAPALRRGLGHEHGNSSEYTEYLESLSSCMLLGQEFNKASHDRGRFLARLGALVAACARRVARLGLLQESRGHDRRMAVALSASGVGLDAGVSMGQAALRLRARLMPHPIALLHLAVPDECLERVHSGAGEPRLPLLPVASAVLLVTATVRMDARASAALQLQGVRLDELRETGHELERDENRGAKSMSIRLELDPATGQTGGAGHTVVFRLGDVRSRRLSLLRAGWACLLHLILQHVRNPLQPEMPYICLICCNVSCQLPCLPSLCAPAGWQYRHDRRYPAQDRPVINCAECVRCVCSRGTANCKAIMPRPCAPV